MPGYKLKGLKEERGKLFNEVLKPMSDALIESRTAWTPEEQETFDEAEARYKEISKMIDVAEANDKRAMEIAALVPAPQNPDKEDIHKRFNTWLRGKKGDADTFMLYLPCNEEERRTMTSIVGSAGGYTVPTGFMRGIAEGIQRFGGVRNHAEIITTTDATDIPWTTNDDTGNIGEQVGEVQEESEQDLIFKQQILRAYGYSSKIVRISKKLLRDSSFDLVAYISKKLGERIGRIQAQKFAIGDGASTPFGIFVQCVTGVTAASSTAVTGDELIDLVGSVDEDYLDENSGWLMNKATKTAIWKLKDGDGNYLWERSFKAGAPDLLLGYPVETVKDAPLMAASNNAIVFGKLDEYKVREVVGIELTRLDELFAKTREVGFVAFVEADGMLLNPGTNPVMCITMAAS